MSKQDAMQAANAKAVSVQEEARAALMIQCAYRQHYARQQILEKRTAREDYRDAIKANEAAVMVQSLIRGCLAKRELAVQQVEAKRSLDGVRKDEAATVIQSEWRMFQAKQDVEQKRAQHKDSLSPSHIEVKLTSPCHRRDDLVS